MKSSAEGRNARVTGFSDPSGAVSTKAGHLMGCNACRVTSHRQNRVLRITNSPDARQVLVSAGIDGQADAMSGLFLAALAALTVQDASGVSQGATQGVMASRQPLEAYRPPAVRPFEPPSNFGRETAQGDEAGTAHRRALETPVMVDAYRRSYETSPSDAELAYDQGVAQAEISQDARMGPLDGRWRVATGDGARVLDLILTDDGGDFVEGAWRGSEDRGTAVMTTRSGNAATMSLGAGSLALTRAGSGWSGTLTVDGRTTAVSMARSR